MAELFYKNKRTISGHIRKIFVKGKLEEHSVVRKFRTTATMLSESADKTGSMHKSCGSF